jgi:hypothetical protein
MLIIPVFSGNAICFAQKILVADRNDLMIVEVENNTPVEVFIDSIESQCRISVTL